MAQNSDMSREGNAMEREMLPGNHKDILPLICFATTLSHHFVLFRLYNVNLHLFVSFSVCSELPSSSRFFVKPF